MAPKEQFKPDAEIVVIAGKPIRGMEDLDTIVKVGDREFDDLRLANLIREKYFVDQFGYY